MKKLLLVVLVIIGLSSCGSGGDPDKCYETVQKEFPKSTIWKMPRKEFTFIVIDSVGTIYYVKTMNWTNSNISTKLVIKQK